MRIKVKTTPTYYLSGMAALNIPSPEGTGDWHMLGAFNEKNIKPIQFIADELFIQIFETDEIEDKSDIANEYGIHHIAPLYCATHYRAIADMAIKSFLSGRNANYIDVDDWLDTDEQKQKVFTLLTNAKTSEYLRNHKNTDYINQKINEFIIKNSNHV